MMKSLLKNSTNWNSNFTQNFCCLCYFQLLTCQNWMKLRVVSIDQWVTQKWNGMTIFQSGILRHGAWNLPNGRLYTQTARLAHFAFSNSWCTSAMEFNAIWWDFLHVPLCTTHIQHELNKSNELLVRRVPFSIFAVVSCWSGECDSDTFTLCALLSVELSQAECRLYANLAYAVHRKPIYMQPILHGNDYGCNQAFLSRKKENISIRRR